jgi:glutamate carboxypeptidase
MINKTQFKNDLEYLVNIDSGTYVASGVNRVGNWFADRFREMGWNVVWHDHSNGKLGRSFLTTNNDSEHYDLLILAHLDTVFPDGEAKKRPFSVDGTKFRGPGVADMKSGLLFTYYALRDLNEQGKLQANIAVYFNNEHEISCPNTRSYIEEISRQSKIVMTPEPSRSSGAYVNRRKGIGRYKVSFFGKSAHSGVNPEDGVNAVNELAHWVLFLEKFNNADQGVSVNSGIVKGGISVNSVPGEAELYVDTRFFDIGHGENIDRQIREKVGNPFNAKVHIELEGGIRRPSMIPTEKTLELCRLVEQLGEKNGMPVTWETSGGGSDASFAAALGIPSLCGLAGLGGNLHTENEYLETADIELRFEMYQDIILHLSRYSQE